MGRCLASSLRRAADQPRITLNNRFGVASSLACRTGFALFFAVTVGGTLQPLIAAAHAAPDPRVEYLYNVSVRRQYTFPDNDALGYGYSICDKLSAGEGYPQLMDDVKRSVTPSDEFAANYLISYAVNLLCPAQIWHLRNSAQHYQPPPGA